jgi:hypothetical protein
MDERRRQAEEGEQVERLREVAEQWSAGCAWCRAGGRPAEAHVLSACREDNADRVQAMVARMQGVRWDAYSCCFDCGFPQEVCSRWASVPGKGGFQRIAGGSQCQWGGVWAACGKKGTSAIRARMRERGVAWAGETEPLVRWMGRKIRWGGLESNEMCRVAVDLYGIWRHQSGEDGGPRQIEPWEGWVGD